MLTITPLTPMLARDETVAVVLEAKTLQVRMNPENIPLLTDDAGTAFFSQQLWLFGMEVNALQFELCTQRFAHCRHVS
jgi:hypothetical protein